MTDESNGKRVVESAHVFSGADEGVKTSAQYFQANNNQGSVVIGHLGDHATVNILLVPKGDGASPGLQPEQVVEGVAHSEYSGKTSQASFDDLAAGSGSAFRSDSRSRKLPTWKSVVVGLGLTALAGGGVGGYFGAKAGHPDQVEPEPIELFEDAASRNILFETGSANLTPQGVDVLNQIAQIVKHDQDADAQINCVRIIGHASAPGNNNAALAQARSNAVYNELRFGHGLPDQLLDTQAFGATQTLSGPQGYDQRVELEADEGPC